MTTPVPPPDEPDIYEALIEVLITASTAHLEASSHFEIGLKHIDQSLELHRHSEEVMEQSLAVEQEAARLMSEAVRLIRSDPQENITRAIALMADAGEVNRRARAISAGAYAITRQASDEMRQGLSIWGEGTAALRIGLERAATLLQQARRRQTNGDRPDAQAA